MLARFGPTFTKKSLKPFVISDNPENELFSLKKMLGTSFWTLCFKGI